MSKQIYLHVPEPCHEDWNLMTSSQQGRFCQSCSKTVVDFSHMTDKQILDTLSKTAGKTCGRFNNNQLARPIVKEVSHFVKPYKLILSSLVPAFIITGAASGQQAGIKGKVAASQQATPHDLETRTLGALVVIMPSETLVSGHVLLENGSAATGATITIQGTKRKTVADENGNFSLSLPGDKQTAILEVSYLGYKTKEVKVKRNHLKPFTIKLAEDDVILTGFVSTTVADEEDEQAIPEQKKPVREVVVQGSVVNKNNEPLPYATVAVKSQQAPVVADSAGNFSFTIKQNKGTDHITATHTGYEKTTACINLKNDDLNNLKLILEPKTKLEDVTVISYPTYSCTLRTGGVSVVRSITIADTAKTFVQKLFNNQMFRVYPNPVMAGQTLNMSFKKEGNYHVQLFDNSGKLYLEREIFVIGEKDIPFMLPAAISKGVYYLKAINASAKNSFIDKLIVQ